MGDPVNLAARLSKASQETGGIYCDERVTEYLAPLGEMNTLKPMKVKGKKDEVRVSSLVKLHESNDNVEIVDYSKVTQKIEIFGRDQALNTVMEAANTYRREEMDS
jgi:hypothetical protein